MAAMYCFAVHCSHLLQEVHHGHLIFAGSSEDSKLIIMILCQSDDTFDVLFL